MQFQSTTFYSPKVGFILVRPTGIEPASWVLEARDNPSCPRTQFWSG